MTATVGAPAGPPPQKFRLRAPKFVLAVPSFVWYVFLFVIPVALVLVNSFGSKIQGSPGKVNLDNPTLDRYREVRTGAFKTVLVQTMQTSILGTVLCLL